MITSLRVRIFIVPYFLIFLFLEVRLLGRLPFLFLHVQTWHKIFFFPLRHSISISRTFYFKKNEFVWETRFFIIFFIFYVKSFSINYGSYVDLFNHSFFFFFIYKNLSVGREKEIDKAREDFYYWIRVFFFHDVTSGLMVKGFSILN